MLRSLTVRLGGQDLRLARGFVFLGVTLGGCCSVYRGCLMVLGMAVLRRRKASVWVSVGWATMSMVTGPAGVAVEEGEVGQEGVEGPACGVAAGRGFEVGGVCECGAVCIV